MRFLLLLSAVCLIFLSGCSENNYQNIKNDVFWDTVDGEAIYSQGGGVFRFVDSKSGKEKYFWYGVHYKEAELYRANPVKEYDKCTFVSVTCYSSDDLVNWTFEGDVLTNEEAEKLGKANWLGRMGVTYIQEIEKYALFIQHNANILVALSDSPTGNFKSDQLLDITEFIGYTGSGDQTVFVDEESGKSYLVYSKPHGRNRIYISEIGMVDGKVGLKDCTHIFSGEGREGNCMFKHNGKYYMFASNLYGWDSSFAYYLVADDIRGPYFPHNDMLVAQGSEKDYAHISQTGFFISVKGSEQETVVFCGDRWADFAGNGLGYNQWCPLSFEGETPYFNSLNSWELDAKTGNWRVAEDNDYVKNGSFEADRRYIPSPVKPVQDFILGWETEVIEGNKVAVNDSLSPTLNYFNSQEDRRFAEGEKSLQISDKVDFRRRISQVIESDKFVELPDGNYRLSAIVKHNSRFNELVLFAKSGEQEFVTSCLENENSWNQITLNNVVVKNNSVEVGIFADGNSDAFALIDKVSFIKEK